jgi:serine/threonine protein kinase/Tol biopolymer transport system component
MTEPDTVGVGGDIPLAGRYRIERELGHGGMATVYLAQDLKHERRVAVKVLKPELAAVLGSQRFLTEVRTTANLQHPHILSLFDSGEVGGTVFYVMPYLEGESLRERLERESQLPIEDAIRIAVEVAGALDYAHRHGVIHRDIKPENILLHDGQALVADFGIALAAASTGGERLTETGLSLGTPAYMSPEQAVGERNIDARSDVYALGCVLYEMLTGQPPFTGRSAQAILARVITERPASPRALRDTVSAGVEAATLRALARLPADRFASAAEFARALSDGASTTAVSARHGAEPSASSALAPPPTRRLPLYRDVRTWIAVAAAAAALFFAFLSLRGREPTSGPPILSTLLPGPGEEWAITGSELALSPDGRQLVVGSVVDGADGPLLLRSLDTLGSVILSGTTGATDPFWSPDGTALGFFAAGRLQVLDLASRAVRDLCPAANPVGGTWTTKGEILYTPDPNAGLYAAPASGGPCRALLLRGDTLPRGRPFALPDGDHFLLTSRNFKNVDFGSISARTLARLDIPSTAEAMFAPPDFILALQGSGLGASQGFYAQRIDTRTGRLVAGPFFVFGQVSSPGGRPIVSTSAVGSLVVVGPGESTSSFMFLAPRGGATRDSVKSPGWMFRYSHDGRHLVIAGVGLWVLDTDRRVLTRVPVGSDTLHAVMVQPVWSPGDTALVFAFGAGYWRFSLRLGTATRWFEPPAGRPGLSPDDWSPDGRWIVMDAPAGGAAAHSEIWAYDTSTNSWVTVVSEPANVGDARVSPDGRWIAYRSNIDGSDQIYLRPFMRPGNAVRVSPGAGTVPRWRGDGRELFYTDPTGAIMAVTIQADGAPGTPSLALPRAVRRYASTLGTTSFNFEPTPDGAGFAYRGPAGRSSGGLTLVLNWPQLLRRDALNVKPGR